MPDQGPKGSSELGNGMTGTFAGEPGFTGQAARESAKALATTHLGPGR